MKLVIQGELANKDAKKIALFDSDTEVALTYIVPEGTSRFNVRRSTKKTFFKDNKLLSSF